MTTATAVTPLLLRRPSRKCPALTTGDAMGDAMGEPVVTRVIITNPSPSRESNNVQKDLGPPSGMQLKPIYESLVGYNPDTAQLEAQAGQVLEF